MKWALAHGTRGSGCSCPGCHLSTSRQAGTYTTYLSRHLGTSHGTMAIHQRDPPPQLTWHLDRCMYETGNKPKTFHLQSTDPVPFSVSLGPLSQGSVATSLVPRRTAILNMSNLVAVVVGGGGDVSLSRAESGISNEITRNPPAIFNVLGQFSVTYPSGVALARPDFLHSRNQHKYRDQGNPGLHVSAVLFPFLLRAQHVCTCSLGSQAGGIGASSHGRLNCYSRLCRCAVRRGRSHVLGHTYRKGVRGFVRPQCMQARYVYTAYRAYPDALDCLSIRYGTPQIYIGILDPASRWSGLFRTLCATSHLGIKRLSRWPWAW